MTIRFRIIMLSALLCILWIIVAMVKKRELELKYVLAWITGEVILIVFVCFPKLMDWLAQFLGIYSPVNMILFLGLVFSLVIIFSLTIALSRVTAKVRRIAQIVAMQPEELKEYKSETVDKIQEEKNYEQASTNISKV